MYLAGTATFNLTMNSTQFTCSSTGGFGAVTDLQQVLTNVNSTSPLVKGNIFTLEATATGEINSNFNSYEKCNTTTNGAVYYLYKN